MAVIQKIRDKYAAVVIVVIAISLIGFIMMDAFVGRSRAMSNSGPVGKINGETIDYPTFSQKLELIKDQYQQYGQPAPPQDQLVNNLWLQTVEDKIIQQECNKLGLQYTAKEFSDYMFGSNPPQWAQQAFTDPNTKQYDINKVRQFFSQLKKNKVPNSDQITEAYILPTINQQLRAKYTALLSNSTYVPKWMAEKSLADKNAVARFSYVNVQYSSITDTTIKATDDDVKAYMNKHKELFEQDEPSRSVSYVAFSAAPSADDSANVRNGLSSLRDSFTATADPAKYLLKAASETPYSNRFTPASKLTTANADTIKKLAKGQVFGPYVDGKNYTIAKMIDVRTMPDSVKVRHILIAAGQTRDDSAAHRLADSIQMLVKNGASFDTLVQKFSDDPGSKAKNGVYDYFPFGQMVPEFNDFAFEGKIGDKGVVKTQYGYHYIEILGQKNFTPAYKVAYLSKPIEAGKETVAAANAKASSFAGASRNKQQFEANATKQNLQVLPIVEIKKNDAYVGALGESRQLVRWIFDNKVGDVSEPQEIADKYVVAVITSESDDNMMTVAKARQQAEPQILKEKKAKQIIATKFKSGGSLEQIAQAAGTTVMHADSVAFASGIITGIGDEPKVVGAAHNKALLNKTTEPIAGNTGVFVVQPEEIKALPNTSMTVETELRELEMRAKQMGGSSYQALKKAAEIKDNRFAYY